MAASRESRYQPAAAGGGGGEPITWEQTKDHIRVLQGEVASLLDRAQAAGSEAWFEQKRTRRNELEAEGRTIIEAGDIIDAEFPLRNDLVDAAEAKVVEIGLLVDAEILARVPPVPEKASDEAIAAADAEVEAATAARDRIRSEYQAARTARFAKQRDDLYDPEAEERHDELATEWSRASDRWQAALNARRDLLVTDPGSVWRSAQADAAREVVGELRQLGDIEGGHGFHSSAQKKARDATKAAFKSFPTDWVARSDAADNRLSSRVTKARAHYIRSKQMTDKTLGRAEPILHTHRTSDLEELRRVADRYQAAGAVTTYGGRRRAKRKILSVEIDEENMEVRLQVDGGTQTNVGAILTTDGSERCTTHELSHRMEETNPRVLMMQAAFYRRRTVDENGEQMPYTAYMGSRKERVISDGFANEYVGKTYNGQAYEVLSVGMEAVFAGSQGALLGVDQEKADADHRAWVLGTVVAV
jgi:hypothetical protein